MISEKDDVLFSIITVCFNERDTIKKTIESVLNQTFNNYEYIVCDGGSTDGTLEIVESYRKRFEQKGVRYIVHSENDGGIYFGMNIGVALSNGKYLNFMNAGDRFHNQSVLHNVCEEIKKISADIFYGDVVVVERGYGKLRRCTEENLDEGMSISHQAMFIKEQLLHQHAYNVKYRIAADWEFTLSMKQENKVFHKLNIVVADFSAGGISAMKFTENIEECKMIANGHRIQYNYEKKLIEAEDNYKKIRQKERMPGLLWSIYCRLKGRSKY